MKKDKMYKDKGMSEKDYQPGMDQFAGKMMGNANDYMSRADREVKQSASKLRNKAYKGRYD
jgi:hypothetical protein